MLVLDALRKPIESLAFHPDGKRLAAGGGDKSWVAFRDATTGAELARWRAHPTRIPHNLAFHPDGRMLFVAGGQSGLLAVRVHTADVGEYPPGVFDLAVAPGGERVIVDGGSDRLASFCMSVGDDAPSRGWVAETSGWNSHRVAFFPDGERFASAEYRDRPTGPDETRFCIRLAVDGSRIGELGTAGGTPWQTAVSPDGERVALRVGGELLLLPAAGGEPIKLTGPNKKHPTAMAFHPGGRFLAVTCNDRTVRMHDREANWTITRTYEWDAGRLKSVAFSPDGTLAAAGGEKGQVVVWDMDI